MNREKNKNDSQLGDEDYIEQENIQIDSQVNESAQVVFAPLKYYCPSLDCKSESKVVRTFEDVKKEHTTHMPQIQTLDELRRQLKKEDHTLKNIKISLEKEELDQYIDEEISRLSQTFEKVLIDLKILFKDYVTTHIQSLKVLVDLYDAVIVQNDKKILQLQYAIPKLTMTTGDMVIQKIVALSIKLEIEKKVKEIKEKIQEIPILTLRIPSIEQRWSSTLKHPDTQIIANVAQTESGWNMILMEPCFTMSDVKKVTLRITKMVYVMISLCDVNVAKNIRPKWDHRQGVGEGTYSHHNNGSIHPHHLETNQTKGQSLAFSFKDGDILELEWNGPLKQFITTRPSTMDQYVQNVVFGQDAQLYFGVHLIQSRVEIIY